MIRLAKNNEGVMSIISIILVVVVVMVASGFVSILERITVSDEVQGVMDSSGLIALRHGIDSDIWRREERILIDADVSKEIYRQLLEENIQTGENIVRYEIIDLKIHEPNSSSLNGLGIPGRDRGQYFLESTVVLYLKSSSDFVFPAEMSWQFYNFLNGTSNDKKMSVSAATNNPGESVLILRSVTRLVMR